MSDFSKMRKDFSNQVRLERELNLKQLQINRLLNITQAINNNVSVEGLFTMYSSFLSWEMGIKKMLLFVKKDDAWDRVSTIGISEALIDLDITSFFAQFTRLNNIANHEHPLINEFDVVIPVQHKDDPIAYVFIGGFTEDEDMYGKVQFITTITNIIAVAIENKRLFKRQLEQTRLKREMELASEMQQMLVPSTFPKNDNFELASIYKPQIGVGGDYLDFIELEDGKFAFCVADISGKGLAAALLMANFQANLHRSIALRPTLKNFIEELNQALFRTTKGDRFITFFIAEFDPQTRMLRYVNAGHNPPFLLMNNEVQQLKEGCTILGSFKKIPVPIDVGEVHIEKDAMILTYTDGLTDMKDDAGEFITDELLKNFLKEHKYISAEDFNAALMQRIELFRGAGEEIYPDDFTVLTCKIFAE